MDLYAENILDHYRNPQHSGKLENATVTVSDSNPLCGDKIEIGLRIDENGTIQDAKFTGEGCAISLASAS
ncbi:MAG TPA: iron-sulfur cluster assembly scaffold protein, partial [Candidatus Gracilibacteria bacterium]|nr:iron-sulfur cluster assembly scaffold protein [Candidatus Gracilibacteria bacterium]